VLGRGGGLSVLHVVLTPVVGWSFGLAGLVACLRPRWRRVGALMVAVGLAWFVHLLDWTHVPALEAAAAPLRNAYAAVFAHLLLAFPTGRLGSKATRALAAAGYVDAVGLHLVATTTGATIWYDVEAAAGVVLAAIVMAVLVRRTLKNAPRPATVVWCAALVACAALVGNLASAWLAPDLTLALWVVFSAAFSTRAWRCWSRATSGTCCRTPAGTGAASPLTRHCRRRSTSGCAPRRRTSRCTPRPRAGSAGTWTRAAAPKRCSP
jgi:hypothetical protein